MAIPICPSCQNEIASDDINVAQNVAYCRYCQQVSSLTDYVEQVEQNLATANSATNSRLDAVDPSAPPKGAYYKNTGIEYIVGTSNRDLRIAGFMLFFTGFWNTIVSIFVFGIIASWVQYFGGNLPAWFPSAASIGGSNLGMTIFLTIFMLPFIAVGLITLSVFLTSIAGKLEIRIRGAEGVVFTGIGFIGWKKRFDASSVKSVTIETADSTTNGKADKQIVIETQDDEIKTGLSLNKIRRRWIAGMLNQLLVTT